MQKLGVRCICGIALFVVVAAGCSGFEVVVNQQEIPSDASDGSDVDAPDSDADVPSSKYQSRIQEGLLALYDFEENAEWKGGETVHDRAANPVDLTIVEPANVMWLKHALRINDFMTIPIHSNAMLNKVATACKATNEVSIEAWVVPSLVSEGSDTLDYGRIVTMANTDTQNFALGTYRDINIQYTFSGEGGKFTPGGTVKNRLTHLVATRTNEDEKQRLYVNGKLEGTTPKTQTDLQGWENSYLWIGNGPAGGQGWKGDIHLIAIYDRALSQEEVTTNFEAGADPEP